MNEALIKNLIKYKLNVADSIIDSLPTRISKDMKNIGKIILESVNESVQEKNEQPDSKSKSVDKLEKVTIE